MAITEQHAPNFEWTSKEKDVSRKACACYNVYREKKAAVQIFLDGLKDMEPPKQNPLQEKLLNHCPNHCKPPIR
jgi:hypothetical protein